MGMSESLPPKKVYLAGGFRSGWQAGVSARLPQYIFLDPSSHNIQNPAKYARWDLDAIRESDVVLANMEATNPGGYSLALEVGFAKALGKIVIFIDQISDPTVSRYFEMVRQCSDLVFKNIEEAVEHLRQLR